MIDIESILKQVTRSDGTQLTESDGTTLRSFYTEFVDDSDAELERKRGVMRERVRLHDSIRPALQTAQKKMEQLGRLPPNVVGMNWADPHLDRAKHVILTATIKDRQKSRTTTRAEPRPVHLIQEVTKFDEILLRHQAKRLDGTSLTPPDIAKLRAFYDDFINDSESEIERKREDQRNKVALHTAWNVWTIRNQIGVSTNPNPPPHVVPDWPDQQLDSAKLLVLKGIIEDRNSRGCSDPLSKLSKPVAAPVSPKLEQRPDLYRRANTWAKEHKDLWWFIVIGGGTIIGVGIWVWNMFRS
jgi:hypothetical protein